MSVDVTGQIYFYSHTIDGSPPWGDVNPKLDRPITNYVQIPKRVPIHDLRGKENHLHLDINGLELHKYNGNTHNVFDDNSIEQQSYYQDIVNVLKKRLGASRVIVFNHIIRFRGTPRPVDQCDDSHKNPVFYPHVDSNPSSAELKVKEIVGDEEANKVMKNRFQIVNVWRPLGPNPIVNTPLAICDYQTIDVNHDVHMSEVRGSKGSVSVYMISGNVNNTQKWYYVSNMKSDEMFIFKIYDSKKDVAQFGAHTAFMNDCVPSSDVEQCSIEIRCLVFYDQ